MRLFLLLILLVLSFPIAVFARYDPLSVPNNKYGIHIIDPNDLPDAARLANSSGGDWGYVTIVIQEDDRNKQKWQDAFDRMRRLHLIPIVRLATHIENGGWTIPKEESVGDWMGFLDSLNWPTQNRYVVLFNEPNHANEWGNTINPGQYAKIAIQFAQKLHETHEDFFVMYAGMDVSASNGGGTMDALTYYRAMLKEVPRLFDEADGLSSHSYPNPAFSASPYDRGRGSLRSFEWELDFLRSAGFDKSLPVFITETGWVHREGVSDLPFLHSSDTVADYFRIAAENVWNHSSIVAVTPFVLSYQGYPFDHFSWKKIGSNEYYRQFFTYHALPKAAGSPRQYEKYILIEPLIPETVISGSSYRFAAHMQNAGQAIIDASTGYRLEFSSAGPVSVISDPLPVIEPGQAGEISLHMDVPGKSRSQEYILELVRGTQRILLQSGVLAVEPPPSGMLELELGWRKHSNARDATVLIYEGDTTLVHKFNGQEIREGRTDLKEFHNIVPGRPYRVVVLVPYYLPRQTVTSFSKDTTTIRMKKLYPFDLNRDGAATMSDLLAMVRLPPKFILSLFF